MEISQVLEWLNPSPFDPEKDHLSKRIRSEIKYIQRTQLQSDDLLSILNRLFAFSQLSVDKYEYPEVLIYASAAAFRLGLNSQARDYIRQAIAIYETLNDRYRRSVALWIGGMIEMVVGDSFHAYILLKSSKDILVDLLESEVQLLIEELPENVKARTMRQKWIDRYIQRLSAMEISMAGLLEEAFTWLNVFRSVKSSFGTEAKILQKKISLAISLMDFDRLRLFADNLESLAIQIFNHTETPEILTYLGLIRIRYDMIDRGIQNLRQAIEMFLPNSHKQCVCRWMYGLALLNHHGNRHIAISNMERCISGFKQLMVKADNADKSYVYYWYQSKIYVLEDALKDILA